MYYVKKMPKKRIFEVEFIFMPQKTSQISA